MDYHSDKFGIHRPSTPVEHRDDEYEQSSFTTLLAMQERHFWYRGRHRFLMAALNRFLPPEPASCAAVDLGGGAGGWVRYLAKRHPNRFQQLALADSSEIALRMAGEILPANVERYQIDLMSLGWKERWNVAFLLDVIEHLPNDIGALQQASEALRPGGLLFVTTPAFQQFWSYNDELAHHLRRYTRTDFAKLANEAGLELCDARYFMFFLSPLYWLARRKGGIEHMSVESKRDLMERTHRVPPIPVNLALTAAFAAETPVGHWLQFPWGTSICGVFRKP